MSTLRIPTGVRVVCDELVATTPPIIPRSRMGQETSVPYPVKLTDLYVWNAPQTRLPGTSSSDDLALVMATFGTNSLAIQTYDVKTVGATALYAGFEVAIPAEYDAGETLKFRLSAGMVGAVADTTCTADISAYLKDRDGTITGSDLVTTAAQDMNDLTFADLDFTITPTGLTAGDVLNCRVAIIPTDGAGGSSVVGRIGVIELLATIRG